MSSRPIHILIYMKLYTYIYIYIGLSDGGGSDLWGSCGCSPESVVKREPQSFLDGRLEVVGVHSVMDLGCAQVGVSSAVQLAQVCDCLFQRSAFDWVAQTLDPLSPSFVAITT